MNIEEIGIRVPINKTAQMVIQKGIHFDHVGNPDAVWSQLPIRTRPFVGTSEDLTGIKIGRLTVIGLNDTGVKGRWVVRCTCGLYGLRKARAIKNPHNFGDRCDQCRKVAQMRRHSYWKETNTDLDVRKL